MALSGPGGSRDDEDAGAFVDINITPLTDVILVLLVIFMVASTAIVESERAGRERKPEPQEEAAPARERPRGLPVDLPKSSLSETASTDTTPVLALTAAGGLELDGQAIARDEVASRLVAAKLASQASELVLAASGLASHAVVVELIEAARKAGFERVVIGTVPATNEDAPPGLEAR